MSFAEKILLPKLRITAQTPLSISGRRLPSRACILLSTMCSGGAHPRHRGSAVARRLLPIGLPVFVRMAMERVRWQRDQTVRRQETVPPALCIRHLLHDACASSLDRRTIVQLKQGTSQANPDHSRSKGIGGTRLRLCRHHLMATPHKKDRDRAAQAARHFVRNWKGRQTSSHSIRRAILVLQSTQQKTWSTRAHSSRQGYLRQRPLDRFGASVDGGLSESRHSNRPRMLRRDRRCHYQCRRPPRDNCAGYTSRGFRFHRRAISGSCRASNRIQQSCADSPEPSTRGRGSAIPHPTTNHNPTIQ
jgi:hypothetical protein